MGILWYPLQIIKSNVRVLFMIEKIKQIKEKRGWGLIATFIIIFTIISLLAVGQYFLYQKIKNNREIAEVSYKEISEKANDLETILLSVQAENTTLADLLAIAEEKSNQLKEEFNEVNDNVEDLTKITTTDPELLQKYSKVYFLNEHYAPIDLKTISSKYTYNTDKKYEIHEQVWPYLKDLLEDAEDDGMSLQIISAFRSFNEQSSLKGAYTVTYGAGTANQFSADQGYSEHQLGTTVDFTTPEVGSTYSGFAQTKEYKWLRENAQKYGFVLSYPENNSYYQFEPWHWRFVGKKLARDLHKEGKFFYDLTQRKIDSYIVDLFN